MCVWFLLFSDRITGKGFRPRLISFCLHVTAALTQQPSSSETTLVPTGTVNNFIKRPQPPLIEQKHTNNMEKHFLFLPLPCHHKAGYPVCP